MHAIAGEFEDFCELGDLNCEKSLEMAGVAVPEAPPTVVETRLIPEHPEAGADGGRVLTVCGVDGRGEPYRSEVFVHWHGDRLRALDPVYWAGAGVVEAGTSIPVSPPEPSGC